MNCKWEWIWVDETFFSITKIEIKTLSMNFVFWAFLINSNNNLLRSSIAMNCEKDWDVKLSRDVIDDCEKTNDFWAIAFDVNVFIMKQHWWNSSHFAFNIFRIALFWSSSRSCSLSLSSNDHCFSSSSRNFIVSRSMSSKEYCRESQTR